MEQSKDRIVFIDWIRVLACLMVVITHCVEPFYLGGEGTRIASASDGLLCTVINSAMRSCVPLFVIVSGFLLFPIKGSVRRFASRRFVRVFIPLVIWLLFYAIVPLPGSSYEGVSIWRRLLGLSLNFPDAAGPLWFGYMILGVYIGMIIFSPWISQVSKRGEEIFLGVWAVSTLAPLLRKCSVMLGGDPFIWGEAHWNSYGTLYYVAGFMGYIVLAHYLRKYHSGMSARRTWAIAAPLWVLGFAITALWFYLRMPSTPYEGPLSVAVDMETSWNFCSIGPALMAIGLFMVLCRIKASGWVYQHIVLPISKASYGLYLMHYFVLCGYMLITPQWGLGMPLTVLLTAVLTFGTSALLSLLIQHIPGGKYIVG